MRALVQEQPEKRCEPRDRLGHLVRQSIAVEPPLLLLLLVPVLLKAVAVLPKEQPALAP